MNTERSEAISWLLEYGKTVAAKAEADKIRDEWIWRAYKNDVSKAEIARVAEVSWATVDRAVREMEAKEDER